MLKLAKDTVILAFALQVTILIVAPGYGMTYLEAQPYAWGLTAVYAAVMAVTSRKR
jgi:hypothetical protein